jgi:hypothetical protein
MALLLAISAWASMARPQQRASKISQMSGIYGNTIDRHLRQNIAN